MDNMKTYEFGIKSDMISLAKEIQSKVYWGGNFNLDGEDISWKFFWDVVADKVENEFAKTVTILSDSNTVIFMK